MPLLQLLLMVAAGGVVSAFMNAPLLTSTSSPSTRRFSIGRRQPNQSTMRKRFSVLSMAQQASPEELKYLKTELTAYLAIRDELGADEAAKKYVV